MQAGDILVSGYRAKLCGIILSLLDVAAGKQYGLALLCEFPCNHAAHAVGRASHNIQRLLVSIKDFIVIGHHIVLVFGFISFQLAKIM